MNKYFIESKQPIFVSFNHSIRSPATDLDFDLLIQNLEENFEKEQEESWLKFWQKQGEEEVLQKWNVKYKHFLKEQDRLVETEEKEDNKQEEINISEEACESNDTLHKQTWEDLWHEHREETYREQYYIFKIIFYNYFFHLKKSCENIRAVLEDEDEEVPLIDDNQSQSTLLAYELEQLKILGLPTSFGGRSHNSSKIPKKPIIDYSDLFSDSEMENGSNESDVEGDVEDYGITTAERKESDNFLHSIQQKNLSKIHKKRNRKLKNVPAFILEDRDLLKYWRKRFSLFSRFDEGIRLDRESWFSVTPEKVAKHLAERLKTGIIIDGCCGSGGNIIQFALTCDKVIAIDIDPAKLEMAKHNAQIYKVDHKIEFILGDFLQLAAGGKLKADIVFLSPPWGGPKYKNQKAYDIEKYLLPVSASELIKACRYITESVALFLPRNSNLKQIVKLAGIGKRCEIEYNYLDSRLVALTALYGEDILTNTSTIN